MLNDIDETPFELGYPSAPTVPIPGVFVPLPPLAAENRSETRMANIIRVLEDPEETDLAQAMRWLAVEIAATLQPVQSNGTTQVPKTITDRIKNLRELSKQIQESADMSSRDFLNFDGPRFQYVFKELMIMFRSSVIKGGLPPQTADHILRVFHGEFLGREARLRTETAKVDPSLMASVFTVESIPEPEVLPPPPSLEDHPHA